MSVFHVFLDCTNGVNLRKVSHMILVIKLVFFIILVISHSMKNV